MSGGRKNQPLREFAWVWVWLTLVVSVAVGTTITVLLWGNTPTNHRDAFDIGWKSSAAVLAILAAFVTVERLRLSQREHHRQLDNDEATHINTLSSQASEQLGSDKAAVRIGGLTDLERLAEQYPSLRQTVVDRICAYLRAPYLPPPELAAPAVEPKLVSESTKRRAGIRTGDAVATSRLELDVRRTAQQILRRLLRTEARLEASPHEFWEKISIDLRDAVLVELDLMNCKIASADFRNAAFYGEAWFGETKFDENAGFDGAKFGGEAQFINTRFGGRAGFKGARFDMGVVFTGTKFHHEADFTEANIDGRAWFNGALFFERAWFHKAKFDKKAVFSETSFGGQAVFSEVKSKGGFAFNGSRVDDSDDQHVWPDGWHVSALFKSPGKEGLLVPVAPLRDDGPHERSGDES